MTTFWTWWIKQNILLKVVIYFFLLFFFFLMRLLENLKWHMWLSWCPQCPVLIWRISGNMTQSPDTDEPTLATTSDPLLRKKAITVKKSSQASQLEGWKKAGQMSPLHRWRNRGSELRSAAQGHMKVRWWGRGRVSSEPKGPLSHCRVFLLQWAAS